MEIDGKLSDLQGTYSRIGDVDLGVEAQYKGLGLVLIRPVIIDEFLVFPERGTHGDQTFIVRKRSNSGYFFILPKADITLALNSRGSVEEAEDGSLLIRKLITLPGEGTGDTDGREVDHIYMEQRGRG